MTFLVGTFKDSKIIYQMSSPRWKKFLQTKFNFWHCLKMGAKNQLFISISCCWDEDEDNFENVKKSNIFCKSAFKLNQHLMFLELSSEFQMEYVNIYLKVTSASKNLFASQILLKQHHTEGTFFSPMPCTYFMFAHRWHIQKLDQILQLGDARFGTLSWLAPFLSHHLIPERIKNIWMSQNQVRTASWCSD